jgi:hypothetical protein
MRQSTGRSQHYGARRRRADLAAGEECAFGVIRSAPLVLIDVVTDQASPDAYTSSIHLRIPRSRISGVK